MEALAVHLKTTYMQLKIYIWFILSIIVLGTITELFILLVSDIPDITTLSKANMLIILLLLAAIVLPLSYYKRIAHLGVSRVQYYMGLHAVYAVWAIAIALINSLWNLLQIHVFHNYDRTVELVEAFHWNDFGFAGAFLYQTIFFLLVMAFLGMLVSGYSHPVGWLLSALIITAIPIGTAIPALRVHVASFFETLLFNDSLLLGVGCNLLLYFVFVAGGWLFTRVRVH
ncbi:hypothetical protein [Paenibacillus macerans]|uniref:hypothetical protein n=1 Tax=Paenibacillus macerans TaxID=44252 RepID=UPI0020416147|nr:hypothetical protein [Paenibacillus macerans]MCM3701484.1 hypothetical protein [Paenibacillus macerans]